MAEVVSISFQRQQFCITLLNVLKKSKGPPIVFAFVSSVVQEDVYPLSVAVATWKCKYSRTNIEALMSRSTVPTMLEMDTTVWLPCEGTIDSET